MTLLEAVRANDAARVQALLEGGADPDGVEGGVTPLYAAAECGSVDAARVLLDHGADVNFRPWAKHFPLTVAIKSGHVDVVNLLSRDARLTYYSVVVAVEARNKELVTLLLDAGAPVDPDETDEDSWGIVPLTPLVAAVKMADVDMVKLLIDRKADVNMACHEENEVTTPLIAATKAAAMNVIKVLIDSGADVNQQCRYYKDWEGRYQDWEGRNATTTTALAVALEHEGKTCLDLVRILYNPGARMPAEMRGVLDVISRMLDMEEQMFRPGGPGYKRAKRSFEDACAE
jgi:hypothetical protein